MSLTAKLRAQIVVSELNTDNHRLYKLINDWGHNCLLSLGYTINNITPEDILITPWSYVARFLTSDGYVYLKHMPALLSLEAKITTILSAKFKACVPTIIAQNAELNCFLMKDAGEPLRGILKLQFDATLFCKAVDDFTKIQLTVADHINVFLDIGVPDWRLDKLPGLFEDMLSRKDVLMADGLSKTELVELVGSLPNISNYCNILLSYPIKQTIVQCDFHDNNILVASSSRSITFIDLGEVVISHPFFSLVGCIKQIKKHHALTEDNDNFIKIQDACFKNFINSESKINVQQAFETAKILWFVYEVLCQYRLMSACGKERILSYQQGKFSASLREFLTISKNG